MAETPQDAAVGSGVAPVEPGEVRSEGARVEIRRTGLLEWYENSPEGLEQGFTIEVPPSEGISNLVLEMALEGDLRAELAQNGMAVTFRHEATGDTIHYSSLAAWDAAGRRGFGTALLLGIAYGASIGGVVGANLYVKFVDELNRPATLWLIFSRSNSEAEFFAAIIIF